jgi:Histidine kinase-, DNA gyrase B-, and HSP90-like ATPase
MSHAHDGGGKTLPMTVDNVGFLLDRLGQDCSPLQYLRELTQNAIEAVLRTGEPGQICWDVDWTSYDLGSGPMKVCIVDTGDGMTGDDMIRLINQLSSSGTKQSFTGNYGVGAKIAAATRHPAGVIYQSWKNGEGCMVQLEKNSITDEYGLRQWELKDGTYSYYVPFDDAVKPAEIGTHGTKVILAAGGRGVAFQMDFEISQHPLFPVSVGGDGQGPGGLGQPQDGQGPERSAHDHGPEAVP